MPIGCGLSSTGTTIHPRFSVYSIKTSPTVLITDYLGSPFSSSSAFPAFTSLTGKRYNGKSR